MAVRKNPDFMVWLADVWHWARRPPGIYIIIVAFLGFGLWYSLSNPILSRNIAWSPGPQQPQATPQALPQPVPPPVPYSDRCPSDYIFIERLNSCVLAVAGTQNNCPDDFIYLTRLGVCTAISATKTYQVYQGNQFTVSAGSTKIIDLIEGAALVTEQPSNKAYFLSPGDRITIYGAATFRATFFSRISISYE
jgi:hypothetical protein